MSGPVRPFNVLPDWNDLPESLRVALVNQAEWYCVHGLGGDAALAIYNVLRAGFPEQTFPLFARPEDRP